MKTGAGFFQALGWPEAPSSDEHYRVFQLENGVVLALWGADNYVRSEGERAEGFRGFTLGLNVGSWPELEELHGELGRVVEELEEIQRADWGGGFTFRDPEGNLWEVALADGATVGANLGESFAVGSSCQRRRWAGVLLTRCSGTPPGPLANGQHAASGRPRSRRREVRARRTRRGSRRIRR